MKLAVYCLQVTSPGSSHRTGGGCGAGGAERCTRNVSYFLNLFVSCILMHTSLIACRSQKLKKSADTAFFQRSMKTSGQKLVDQSEVSSLNLLRKKCKCSSCLVAVFWRECTEQTILVYFAWSPSLLHTHCTAMLVVIKADSECIM